MPPVDTHLLGTKTAAIADRSYGASNRPQRRHREIGRLDDGVDVTTRLFNCDSAGRGLSKPQPAADFAQNLLLTFAVHRRLSITVSCERDLRTSTIILLDYRTARLALEGAGDHLTPCPKIMLSTVASVRARRFVRVELKRAEVSYAELARRLKE